MKKMVPEERGGLSLLPLQGAFLIYFGEILFVYTIILFTADILNLICLKLCRPINNPKIS